MWGTYGCESRTVKKVNAKDLMPLKCGAREESWKSFGQQGDQTSQSLGRSTLNIHWKDWCLSWSYRILVFWCEQMPHWKSPGCWERSGAEWVEGIRRWDGWNASPVSWAWTWANSRRWCGIGKPSTLQSMGHKELDMTGQLNSNNNNVGEIKDTVLDLKELKILQL